MDKIRKNYRNKMDEYNKRQDNRSTGYKFTIGSLKASPTYTL